MMKPYELIKNHKSLLDAFSYWPTFHDGEIIKFILDRKFDEKYNCNFSSLEFIIHGWEMTDEVVNDCYKRQKHYLVHFRFDYVDKLEIDGFNHQNVISSLEIKALPKNDKGYFPLAVVIEHCYGISAEFTALFGAIISVTPCSDKGIKI